MSRPRRLDDEGPKVTVSEATRAEFTKTVFERLQKKLDKKQAR
jgi:hypothetical protein